ncbi:hypothetical protein ACBQ16_12585 [Halopseudomonas bauzanensis]|uniref:Oxidase n=1 Tax=Halopseudomonas litoralis TaxID=797277 RepID=A0A1H1LD32_9GAMM|nr:hypothetical protein [Halopseudomonas litoralis]SDR72458.1 hypothetical protein SAMN05216198_0198 [Halopseudomonas litoralis]
MNYRHALLTWLGTALLLGLSVLTAVLLPGRTQYLISLASAMGIAALIMLVYMQLRSADSILRTFALAGLVWWSFLLLITVLEVLTRQQL